MEREGTSHGARYVVVAVDPDPVGATFDPVERAAGDDLSDHAALVGNHGFGFVRHHDQFDGAVGERHPDLCGGPELEVAVWAFAHLSTPLERSVGVELSS